MFPGQGAQSVGMCATICDEVPKAKELFDASLAKLDKKLGLRDKAAIKAGLAGRASRKAKATAKAKAGGKKTPSSST